MNCRTDGPSICGSSWPDCCSTESRICSASSRRTFIRHTLLFLFMPCVERAQRIEQKERFVNEDNVLIERLIFNLGPWCNSPKEVATLWASRIDYFFCSNCGHTSPSPDCFLLNGIPIVSHSS